MRFPTQNSMQINRSLIFLLVFMFVQINAQHISQKMITINRGKQPTPTEAPPSPTTERRNFTQDQIRQLQVLALFERVYEPTTTPRERRARRTTKRRTYTLPATYSTSGGPSYGNQDDGYCCSRTEQIEYEVPDFPTYGADEGPVNVNNIVPVYSSFSHFYRPHREAAYEVARSLTAYSSFDDFIGAAELCREMENPDLFTYSYGLAVQMRDDSRSYYSPPMYQVSPDRYMPSQYGPRAQQRCRDAGYSGDNLVIDDRYLSHTDPEDKLWYFREDHALSAHHYAWHQIYAYREFEQRKDRSGELFYYMHRQMIARYNSERLACGYSPVIPLNVPLNGAGNNLLEGYSSHTYREYSGSCEGSRPYGLYLEDAPGYEGITVSSLEVSRMRIMNAIDAELIDDGGAGLSLSNDEGIDILGRVVEASYSPNREFYGDFHNNGHMILATMQGLPPGPMADPTTAIKDPIFYRWHKHVDDIFTYHKSKLAPYTANDLGFPGVSVDSVGVSTPGYSENMLITGWGESDYDLTRGMRLDCCQDRVNARYKHLQHENFHYDISISNENQGIVFGTVRIYLAPAYDENGDEYSLEDRREFMIEMDRFRQKLYPGSNKVSRSSLDSVVASPPGPSFSDIEAATYSDDSYRGAPPTYSKRQTYEGPEDEWPTYSVGSDWRESSCGCGWPQHMLVPRGTTEGMQFCLIVMVTDADIDDVPQDEDPWDWNDCSHSHSYCGLNNLKYPDSRPMGFPFDRPVVVIPASAGPPATPARSPFSSNIRSQFITIQFKDEFL